MNTFVQTFWDNAKGVVEENMAFKSNWAIGASALALVCASPSFAQTETEDDRTLERIVVTGSYIRGSAEDAALPIDVISSQDILGQGAPQITDLIRNLGVSSGIDGQTNQFTSNGLEGTSNINLRGLGAGRTLVLLNGRRQTFSPNAIGEQAQLFIDTNMIPSAAIQRIEVLKDGAAALYGSDAIAGVVNFITNKDFEGFSVSGDFEFIDGSDGNYNLAVAQGIQFENGSWVNSMGYNVRSELQIVDRDWAYSSYTENPQGGWSSIGNPGAFMAEPNLISFFTNPTTIGRWGSPVALLHPDPNCNALGGSTAVSFRCGFQYSQFDNLIEDEQRAQFFSEFNYDFGGANLHIEALVGFTDVPEWKTSPSYPPNSLLGLRVPDNHPGLQEFRRQNPDWAALVYTRDCPPPAPANGPAPPPAPAYCSSDAPPASRNLPHADTKLVFWGRPFGFSGNHLTGHAENGSREKRTVRFSTSLSGEYENGVTWDIGIGLSQARSKNITKDTKIHGLVAGLAGLAGPDCKPPAGSSNLVPGQNGCLWYNPFSNAIPRNAITGEVNPQYRPQLANSAELGEWMRDAAQSGTNKTRLVTIDGVFSGISSDWVLPGGNVGWAYGFQVRNEQFSVDPVDSADNTINPCAYPGDKPAGDGLCPERTSIGGHPISRDAHPRQPNGQFTFLAGVNPYSKTQNIFSGFAEWQLPFTEKWDVQAALRYEKYPGSIGQTLDPKVAFKFQSSDMLAIRGSAQTSFKGPTLNQLNTGRATTLQYIAATGAFKAVDQGGSPDLDPEKAVSFNLGAVYTYQGLRATIDYYNFNFDDTIIVESHDSIVRAAGAAIRAKENTAPILDRITFGPGGQALNEIERIAANIVNGPTVQTSGVDFRVDYDFESGDAEFTVGAEATVILEYDVGSYQIEGVTIASFDGLGYLNRNNFARSLPELKIHVFGNFRREGHNIRIDARFTSEYEDQRKEANGDPYGTLDSFLQWDATYSLDFTEEYGFSAYISGWNLFDADPPFARLDLNYDPYTHFAFGRMIKIGTKVVF